MRINPTISTMLKDIQKVFNCAVTAEQCHIILCSYAGIAETKQCMLKDIACCVIEIFKEKGFYTKKDIRYAIGQVLMERIGIEY